MSEWKTRITKVQLVKPTISSGMSCLVLIYPPGPEMGKRFPLTTDEVVLGRGSDCDVQIDRDSVSRRHARVFREEGVWMAEDLESTNGTYVNDVPIRRSPLRDSDFLKVGAAIFKFLSGTGVEASYHEEIYRMTIIDGLTGAHNKRYFLEFLEREIARCSRYGRPLSLLIFDIDHFKKINDTHGHLTGDTVLKGVSETLKQTLRATSTAYRYGGEEIAIILPLSSREDARTFAERLRKKIEAQSFTSETGQKLKVTVSLGAAEYGNEMTDFKELISQADTALYRAKQSGRNQTVVI